MSVHIGAVAHKGQKRALGPLELESWVGTIHSVWAAHTFTHWTISLAPGICFRMKIKDGFRQNTLRWEYIYSVPRSLSHGQGSKDGGGRLSADTVPPFKS